MKFKAFLLICLLLTSAAGFEGFFQWGLHSQDISPASHLKKSGHAGKSAKAKSPPARKAAKEAGKEGGSAAKDATKDAAQDAAQDAESEEISSEEDVGKQIDSFFDPGNGFCWKESYGRGVGTIPTDCGSGQLDAGLCYARCKSGFEGVGPMCWKPGKSHPRGFGTIPNSCPTGRALEAGLCYTHCNAGYHGLGPMCWSGAKSHPRGAGTIPNQCEQGKTLDAGLCYPPCPPGYKGVGPACWIALEGYGRGVGTIPKCSPSLEFDASLCYKKCDKGYKGVGPVCWGYCDSEGTHPFDCGAACSTNEAACAGAIVQMIQAVGEVVLNVVTMGGSKAATSSAKAGIKTSMKIAKNFKKGGKLGKKSFVQMFKKSAKKLGESLDVSVVSNIYDSVGTDMNSEADEKPSAVMQAKEALDLASTFDPTGITGVVSAFMFDKCKPATSDPTPAQKPKPKSNGTQPKKPTKGNSTKKPTKTKNTTTKKGNSTKPKKPTTKEDDESGEPIEYKDSKGRNCTNYDVGDGMTVDVCV